MPKSPLKLRRKIGKKFSKPALSRLINEDIKVTKQPEQPQKTRLDHHLVSIHPELNRTTIQKLIKTGQVQVNGETIEKPSLKLSEKDEIKLVLERKTDNQTLVAQPSVGGETGDPERAVLGDGRRGAPEKNSPIIQGDERKRTSSFSRDDAELSHEIFLGGGDRQDPKHPRRRASFFSKRRASHSGRKVGGFAQHHYTLRRRQCLSPRKTIRNSIHKQRQL